MIISLLNMMTRRMHLRVVFFIEREILYCLHDITLANMYDCLDIINQALMLYLCRLLDSLPYFYRVLINFCSQFSCCLYLHVGLCNVPLKNKKHCFVTMQQDFVLVRVKILGWNRMLSHICSIYDTETVLNQYRLIQGLRGIYLRLSSNRHFAFFLLRTYT